MPNDGALAELTRDAGAVLQMAAPGTEAPAWVLRALEARELGGVVLFSRNLVDRAQTAALCASLRAADEDVLIALDEEGGDVTRLEIGEGSSYPGNLALGRADDIRLTEAVGRSIGLDLLEVGVNFNYAPCADVNANASSGGHADVTATQSIKANASSGGGITIHGKPAQTSINSSSGGSAAFAE